MGNIYYDFNQIQKLRFADKLEFYVGVGAGVARNTGSDYTALVSLKQYGIARTLTIESINNHALAVKLTGGATYKMKENLFLDFALNYWSIGHFKLANFYKYNDAPYTFLVDDNLSINDTIKNKLRLVTVSLGLRVMF